jgi:hypothetical protein
VAVLPGGGLSDGGPTTSAKITPSSMAVLPDGGFLIAGDRRMRRVGV